MDHSLTEENLITSRQVYNAEQGRRELVKCYKLEAEKTGVPANVLQLISAHRVLAGPDIVELLDVIPVPQAEKIYLVFEDFEYSLAHPPQLTSDEVRRIMKELLTALTRLHARKYAHQGLSPQHILLDSQLHVKLTGLAAARMLLRPAGGRTFQPSAYQAPELLSSPTAGSPAADMWAVGCIFAELHTGHCLFSSQPETEQLSYVRGVVGGSCHPLAGQVPNLSDEGKDLLEALLEFEASKRLTAAAALSHAYLAS